jgi:hypothetical protein
MAITRGRPKLKEMVRQTAMPNLRRFHDRAIVVAMIVVAALVLAALIAISSALIAASSPYLGGLVLAGGTSIVAGTTLASARHRPVRRMSGQRRTPPGCRRRQMNRTWPVNVTPRPLRLVERRVRGCGRQRHR